MKKKIVFGISAFVLIGWGFYLKLQNSAQEEQYTTANLEKGNLIQTVNETGTLKAVDEIDLNFLNTGKISKINVKLWDQVQAGDVLAELDYNDLLIRKNEAQANLEIAQAAYRKLIAGATAYDISVAQATVNQAQTAYTNALKDFENTKKTQNENLKQSKDRLNDLTSADSDSLTAQEQAVILAETSLQNTKSTYLQIVTNRQETVLTKTESNLAVGNYSLDVIDTLLEDDDIKSALGVKDTNLLVDAKINYKDSVNLLKEAETYIEEYKNGQQNLDSAIDQNLVMLNEVFSNLNQFYTVLENSVTTVDFTQTDLDSKKAEINTQITTVSNAVTALQTAKQNLTDARIAYTANVNTAEENLRQAEVNLSDAVTTATNQVDALTVSVEQTIALAQSQVDGAKEALEIAKAQLAKIKAPATSEDVALQKAQLKQAQAVLASAQNNIEKSVLTAPIDGTVTKINYEIGEMVSTKPIISMLNGHSLEVEVDISETDISKIALDDKAKITLDAFTDDLKFYGKVMEIEPAETVIQDVIYYKVHINIELSEEYEQQVKPGMTANVTITTVDRDDVLIAPTRSIVDRNGEGKFLRVLENGVMVEKMVKVGIRGDDGIIEILSEEFPVGTEVVTYIQKN